MLVKRGLIMTMAALLPAATAAVASAQRNRDFHAPAFRAPWVSCFDSTGQFTGPKNVRTGTLRSSDGKLRAYAEISAAAVGHSDCENTVRLLVLRFRQRLAGPSSVRQPDPGDQQTGCHQADRTQAGQAMLAVSPLYCRLRFPEPCRAEGSGLEGRGRSRHRLYRGCGGLAL